MTEKLSEERMPGAGQWRKTWRTSAPGLPRAAEASGRKGEDVIL